MKAYSLIAMFTIFFLFAACGGTPPTSAPIDSEPTIPAVQSTEPASAAEEESPAGTTPNTNPTERNMPPAQLEGNQASEIEYDQNEMVTSIACDYNKKMMSFTLKNTQEDLLLYHGQVKAPPNTLKFLINGLQFNSAKTNSKLDCGANELKADETRNCVGVEVPFRLVSEDLAHEGKNRLIAKYAGGSDVTYFECNT